MVFGTLVFSQRIPVILDEFGYAGGGFSLVFASFYNEALFAGGTEGECAEGCARKISFLKIFTSLYFS